MQSENQGPEIPGAWFGNPESSHPGWSVRTEEREFYVGREGDSL